MCDQLATSYCGFSSRQNFLNQKKETLTVLILAKTLARKCSSPFRFCENRSCDECIDAPCTNASIRSGRAMISCGSPDG